jgi:hypothetical protein
MSTVVRAADDRDGGDGAAGARASGAGAAAGVCEVGLSEEHVDRVSQPRDPITWAAAVDQDASSGVIAGNASV